MEERKINIPEALNDDVLENVSGGTDTLTFQQFCRKCGKVLVMQFDPKSRLTGFKCDTCSYTDRV